MLAPLLFSAALILLHKAVLQAGDFYAFDCPRWWPFSMFYPRSPTVWQALTAVCTALIAWFGIGFVQKRGWRTAEVAALGLMLVLASNAVQGLPRGFTLPITGGGTRGVQYYHDAGRAVDSPAVFVRDFAYLQQLLSDHGRTHPPGAVLLFYLLRQITGDRPALISMLLAAASVVLTAFAASRLSAHLLPTTNAGYVALLLLLLPAVQIYYCASLDALIASLLLAAVALWAGPTLRPTTAAGAIGFVLGASFLTFGFVWVLPVFAALSWQRKHATFGQRAAEGALLVAAFLAFYLPLSATLGFNYLAALRAASQLENPNGFRLLVEPVSYLFTRLEDVTEILTFLGPFLLFLAVRELRTFRARFPEGFAVTAAAILTLLLLFLTGAYRTGETARACLFAYPYLLLPVAAATEKATAQEQRLLALLVFAQAIVMQAFGAYFW